MSLGAIVLKRNLQTIWFVSQLSVQKRGNTQMQGV
jgi:hypothetical protein